LRLGVVIRTASTKSTIIASWTMEFIISSFTLRMRVELQRAVPEMAWVHPKRPSRKMPRRLQVPQLKMDLIFTMETILLLTTDRLLQRMARFPPR
jgi:hypothetical protein